MTQSQVSNGSGMKISDEASYKGHGQDKTSSRFLSPSVRKRNGYDSSRKRSEAIKDNESIELGPNHDSVSYEFSTAQLRQIKHKRAAVEAEIKTKFVENLIAQIDKRIEQCNFQSNLLKKQTKLYNIYGGAKKSASLVSSEAARGRADNASADISSQEQTMKPKGAGEELAQHSYDSLVGSINLEAMPSLNTFDEANIAGMIALTKSIGLPKAQIEALDRRQATLSQAEAELSYLTEVHGPVEARFRSNLHTGAVQLKARRTDDRSGNITRRSIGSLLAAGRTRQ